MMLLQLVRTADVSKCFTTLFSSMISQIFMLLTLAVMLHVLKLILGLEIPDNQFFFYV